MARLKNNTMVVVTDSEKALFIRNLTDHENPHFEVTDEEHQENPSDIEQSANRPGRMQDTGVTILRPPRDGRMAFIRTPDEISIELLQHGEPLPPKEPWVSMPSTGTW